MRTPSVADLLRAWERGQEQGPLERGLTLLSAAWPESPADVLAGWSIGQRNARLLALRASIFGPRVCSLTACPACDEPLELEFGVDDIWAAPESEATVEGTAHVEGYEVRFRLPNSGDLIAATEKAGNDGSRHATVRRALLQRCLLAVLHDGQAQPVDRLPAQVEQAVVERMAGCDPQADVELALACPACAHQWAAQFDILSFLWTELDAWANRILREVHVLASAYGWREADILALSPRRRQLYLQWVST